MSVKSLISLGDELPVESPLASTRFVADDQQDRCALRIESKSDAPFAAFCREPEFLHIDVTGTVECIGARPSQLLEETGKRENFSPYFCTQFEKLRLELVAHFDHPRYTNNYALHGI